MVPEPLPDDGPGVAFRDATGLQKPDTPCPNLFPKIRLGRRVSVRSVSFCIYIWFWFWLLRPGLSPAFLCFVVFQLLRLAPALFAAFNTFRVCRRCGIKLTHETRRKNPAFSPREELRDDRQNHATERFSVATHPPHEPRIIIGQAAPGRHPHQAQKAVVGPIFLKREVRRVCLEVGRI